MEVWIWDLPESECRKQERVSSNWSSCDVAGAARKGGTVMLTWILTGIFAGLNVLDYLLTREILKNGRELNPILRKAGDKWPIMKGAGAGIAAFLCIVTNADKMLIGFNLMMSAVVIWNFFQWRKAWAK